MEFRHTSVLLKETIEGLNIRPDGIYVDGTLGGAGHSAEICRRLTGGRLIGIDQDKDAIDAAAERLLPYRERTTIVQSNYADMAGVLRTLEIPKVDGILLDLGVSSFQLDTPERGFTYRVEDAPLDMRMDVRQTVTARDIVNNYSEEELFRIIRDYGEERFAKNIAKHIVAARADGPIETTGALNAVIGRAIPMRARDKGHPSKRTYQAIRIALNRELDVLKDHLDEMIGLLAPGGRICVITFHSLEDRIVKACFKKNENPCTCPPDFPVCVCGKKPKGRVISRRPITASAEELERNHRAASAKLRVFEVYPASLMQDARPARTCPASLMQDARPPEPDTADGLPDPTTLRKHD